MKSRNNKVYLIVIIIALDTFVLNIIGFSQNTYVGNAILTNQEEVDQFKEILKDASIIDGYVYIGSPSGESDPIKNLATFSKIKEIKGTLQIGSYYEGINGRNPELPNFIGFDSLYSIGGNFYISSNYIINSFLGFGNLHQVGGSISIHGNDKLHSLSGLNNLTSLGEELDISMNPSLNSLEGLGSISTINYIYIMDNDSLQTLQGLNALTFIEFQLYIGENDQLLTLDGLQNLTSCGYLTVDFNISLKSLNGIPNLDYLGILRIERNTSLTSLVGLENIKVVEYFIEISHNDSLNSLSGLENIDSMSFYGSVTIVGNKRLVDFCALTNFVEIYDIPVTIAENAFYPDFSIGDCKPDETFFVGNFYLTNQEEVNRLPSMIQSKHKVAGGIYIGSMAGEEFPITNLDSLSILQEVSGSIEIGGYFNDIVRENPKLITLSGLNSLQSIGGDLVIYYNSALKSLKGLNNLSFIRSDVSISENPSLNSIDGLDSLKTIGWGLNILENDSLIALYGLNSLTSVNYLDIRNNPLLTELNGLNSLDSIGWYFLFSNNPALHYFQGLGSLRIINGSFEVSDNLNIISFEGLHRLKTLEQLIVKNNPSLISLAGLDTLSSLQSLILENNPKLKSLNGLNSLLFIGPTGNFKIQNNSSLMDFCAITGAILNNTFELQISNNAFNPNLTDFDNGVCATYEIVFSSKGHGNISGDSIQAVKKGSNIKPVTAIPDNGYEFLKWENFDGDSISNSNPLNLFDIQTNMNFNAVFAKLVDVNVELSNIFNFYPNPATDWITLFPKTLTSYKICDLNGRTLIEKSNIFQPEKVDLKILKEGVYIINVKIFDGITSYKLIKN